MPLFKQTSPETRAGKIVNCKGIPGALGCLAWSLNDGAPVILSNWHVMFGNGAVKGDRIWLAENNQREEKLRDAGRIIKGRIGTISFGGKMVYLDCAISSFAGKFPLLPAVNGQAHAVVGEQVYKYGPATGFTSGIVVSVDHRDKALIEGQLYDAPEQLLIRGENGMSFSGEGDSGAVILNHEHKVIGLLWGTNNKREGLACPIEPVTDFLNIGFMS